MPSEFFPRSLSSVSSVISEDSSIEVVTSPLFLSKQEGGIAFCQKLSLGLDVAHAEAFHIPMQHVDESIGNFSRSSEDHCIDAVMLVSVEETSSSSTSEIFYFPSIDQYEDEAYFSSSVLLNSDSNVSEASILSLLPLSKVEQNEDILLEKEFSLQEAMYSDSVLPCTKEGESGKKTILRSDQFSEQSERNLQDRKSKLHELNVRAQHSRKKCHDFFSAEHHTTTLSRTLLAPYPSFEASRILDYLFLGSYTDAMNLKALQALGITHILNVAKECDNNSFSLALRDLNRKQLTCSQVFPDQIQITHHDAREVSRLLGTSEAYRNDIDTSYDHIHSCLPAPDRLDGILAKSWQLTQDIHNALSHSITFLQLGIQDKHAEDITRLFLPSIFFINRTRQSGGKVLIHCHRGISRSPAVVLSYLIHEFHLTLEQAMNHIESRRAQICPNLSFILALEDWRLRNKCTASNFEVFT